MVYDLTSYTTAELIDLRDSTQDDVDGFRGVKRFRSVLAGALKLLAQCNDELGYRAPGSDELTGRSL